jgi:signal transduction histidine kinase
MPVELSVEGDFSDIPDQHRTCVYRIVQEALTNCARHSGAQHVFIRVSDTGTGVNLTIADDGVGIEHPGLENGIGLRGISERVRELQGTMSIRSAHGQGTMLAIQLPLPALALRPVAARQAESEYIPAFSVEFSSKLSP